MKKIIVSHFILFILLSLSDEARALEDKCPFNFKEFHSLLDSQSKKYKKMKAESKDEVSKTITQETRLKTGEHLLFIGGGCTHVGYSFIFSNVKFKSKNILEQFKKAHDLMVYIDVKQGYKEYKEYLVEAQAQALKGPIKRNKNDLYSLTCENAICNLDLSKKKSLKISYIFAL
jgi:hypothetical protein